MFRTVPHFTSINVANYTRYLTPRSIARQPSPIRALTAIQAQAGPEMISLAAGAPNPDLFPFEEIQLKVKGSDQIITMQGSTLNKALQYSPTMGFPPLLKHFQTLQKLEHSYNPELHDIVITPGSQDGLSKVLEAMVNRGDKVIVDAPIYSGTLAILKPIGARLIGIETDENGMNTDLLERSLKKNGKGAGAKLIVTVSNGSNPTGGSLSLERRKRMLEIADHYDCFIIEDDPYYWLSYDEQKIPSLFKLDNDKHALKTSYQNNAPGGRVLRSDSLSKIVSSGIRLGWQTGPKEIIDRVVKAQEASSMHTSTLSQALVAELFENSWDGVEGFREQSDKVVDFYKSRCDAIGVGSFRGISQKVEKKYLLFTIFFFYSKVTATSMSLQTIILRSITKIRQIALMSTNNNILFYNRFLLSHNLIIDFGA